MVEPGVFGMRRSRWGWGFIVIVWLGLIPTTSGQQVVRVPVGPTGDVDLAAVVARLAEATGSRVDPPTESVPLPTTGRSRSLSSQYLAEALTPDVAVEFTPEAVVFAVGPDPANARGSELWAVRLGALATRARSEAERRTHYGFRRRPSYRPNDPARPTVCLIHGLNSTAGVFKHLTPALEAAGYGVVTYDFPYNRDLDETSGDFVRDWPAFRTGTGDSARWVILAHSMGGLLARSLIESPSKDEPSDVSALLMLAPPNHGSSLAQGQTFLQTVQALQSVRGERRTEPLAHLGDGLGAAADDLTPGSAYLNTLNARPRRAGVAYHILAGDSAYLSRESRRQVEASLASAGRIGGLGRLLTAGVKGPLDEITDGLGDGCVAVASTRLAGVADHRVMHVNHLELIRAPLLFPDAGPIASMPTLLEWLQEATGAEPVGR